MGNTFLEMKKIALEALPILRNNLVMASLVHTDYSKTFADKGDTIQVRKPAKLTAAEFDGDLSGEYQDVSETSVEIKMDTIASVDIKLTSAELTQNIEDFTQQITIPAMEALAQKIDNSIMKLYKDIPYYHGSSGTTPDGLEDITGVRKILNKNKCPVAMRQLVIDPEADAKLLTLGSLVQTDKAGTTVALREAILGKIYGMDIYSSQNIPVHTAGSFCEVASPKTTGVTAANASTIIMDGGSGAEKIEKGDIFEIDGQQYVATADATATAGEIDVEVAPAVPTEIADDTDVIFADATEGEHTSNLAFHKSAFAFVSRPLVGAMGGADSATMSFDGLNIRVTRDYNMDTKKHIVSFDILYGVKTLYRELAARLLG